jgi:hypothetical protein
MAIGRDFNLYLVRAVIRSGFGYTGRVVFYRRVRGEITMKSINNKVLLLACVLGIGALPLTGCDSKPQPSIAGKPSVQRYDKVKTLQGLVTNDDGPVKTGIIKVLTENGRELAKIELTDGPQYSIDVPAGTELPVLLAYYPSDAVSDDKRMIAAVVHASASKFDINMLSTRIAKQAKAMGGYTHKNLVSAAEATGTVPASNKTTAGFRGDPTTQYGGWH